MVSVLSSSAEGRGFDPWPGHTKDIKIGICCFSAKHESLRSKSTHKTCHPKVKKICLVKVAHLPVEYI